MGRLPPQLCQRLGCAAHSGTHRRGALACAQAKYPTRSPRLVLPFAAGGVADVTARIVAEKLGDKLGHRLVVDNQPGAGGISAANRCAPHVQTATPWRC